MYFSLLPHIVQNVGFVFTKEDLVEIRDLLLANKVKAPAKAGAIAPLDVKVPAQNTGMYKIFVLYISDCRLTKELKFNG